MHRETVMRKRPLAPLQLDLFDQAKENPRDASTSGGVAQEVQAPMQSASCLDPDDADLKCGWCPFVCAPRISPYPHPPPHPLLANSPHQSNTCVPTPHLLFPIHHPNTCPLPNERFELRAPPLGCNVSLINVLSVTIAIASTLLISLLLFSLISLCRASRRRRRAWSVWGSPVDSTYGGVGRLGGSCLGTDWLDGRRLVWGRAGTGWGGWERGWVLWRREEDRMPGAWTEGGEGERERLIR